MLRPILVASTLVLLACAGQSEAGSNSDADRDASGSYCDPICGATPYYVGSYQQVCTGDTVCGIGAAVSYYCYTANSGQTWLRTNIGCGSCTFPTIDGGTCTEPTDRIASCPLPDGGMQSCTL
jgi:hypothetical protein